MRGNISGGRGGIYAGQTFFTVLDYASQTEHDSTRLGSSQAVVFVSLLHATFQAGSRAVEVRSTWLERADSPAEIEHIFAVDEDDHDSVAATAGFRRVVNPALPGRVTAVRNWNTAAHSAVGLYLFVIADDLLPPKGWDTQLMRIVGSVDPERQAFAIKLSDGDDGDAIHLRHPIVSREFFNKFGLFSPEYSGVYCDDDITARAFWKAIILDGRSIHLEHIHPTMREAPVPTLSQRRISAPIEFEHGRQRFERRWPHWRRVVRYELMPAPVGEIGGGTERGLAAIAVALRVRALARASFLSGRRRLHDVVRSVRD